MLKGWVRLVFVDTPQFVLTGTPTSSGALFVGIPAASPIPIGSGCHVFIDPLTAVLLSPVTTGTFGTWTTSIPIPGSPFLWGLEVTLQAGLVVPTGGVQVTNGLELTLGS